MAMGRIYVRTTVPIRIRVPHDRTPSWSADRRLRVAIANNNSAPWWACRSERSVADLERKFTEGSVARLLYYVTGGIMGDHKRLGYLYMQLSRTDGDVLMCLREIKVEPLGRVAFSEVIRHP